MFLICAEQTRLYFGEIEFSPAYLRWVFDVTNTERKTKKRAMPVPEMPFLGSGAYDLGTRDGRLGAAQAGFYKRGELESQDK
jgi:hypothetical protein